MKENFMLRNFAIAFTTVAALVLAANLQAQGPGGGGGRGPGMMGGPGGGPGGGMMMILQNEKVQKDIELDADQKEKIQKLATETREAMRAKMGDMSNLSQEERRTKMQEMRKDMEEETAKTEKKIEGILLPKQLERIKQIQLQVQGVAALANPDVAKALELTADQQAKVKSINEESMKAMRDMFAGGGRPSAEDRDKMTKARKETETKLMDVLTADQKEKLEKMKGENFDVTVLRGGPGGGGRGNRGGNGGGGPGPVN
jgi:Spy/CpxP family protein refolding chaperone